MIISVDTLEVQVLDPKEVGVMGVRRAWHQVACHLHFEPLISDFHFQMPLISDHCEKDYVESASKRPLKMAMVSNERARVMRQSRVSRRLRVIIH